MDTPTTRANQVQYQPGDVDNGHKLDNDRTTWEPIGQLQVDAQPEPRKRRWLPWAIGAGVVVLGVGVLAAGGTDTDAAAQAEAAAAEAIAEAEAEADAAIAEAEEAAAKAQEEAEALAQEEEAATNEAQATETSPENEAPAPIDPDDSFSAQTFITDARNNIGDLREDLSDAQAALAEGKALGLNWNFAEIAFNTGQLGALAAPNSIAGEWDAAMAELNGGLDAATLGLENDSISEMDSGLARVGAAADTLSALADTV